MDGSANPPLTSGWFSVHHLVTLPIRVKELARAGSCALSGCREGTGHRLMVVWCWDV